LLTQPKLQLAHRQYRLLLPQVLPEQQATLGLFEVVDLGLKTQPKAIS